MNSTTSPFGREAPSGVTISFGVRFATSSQFDAVFREGMALVERTASMLSFVVLETEGTHDERAESRKVRDIRAIADLFVTTTDRGFVRELVDNLAS